MTDDRDFAWPPAMFTESMRRATEEFSDQQRQLFEQMLAASGRDSGGSSGFDPMRMGMRTAMFKTRVQSGGRISIPDAEREALGIDEGDLVQAFVIPITSPEDDDNE